jgi:serine/threonine protein kinase
MGRRFILQRTLGEGAFGSVYLAEMEGQGGFRRKVALKLLNANWDPASDAGRRLRDEARLLGRLQHRNIVRVDDLVRVEGRWALVMEYIGGADLEVVFTLCKAQGRPFPPRAVAEVGAGVAAALEAAWATMGDEGEPLRVIHRDIKPSNVRLSETGDVKVLDFGVARANFEGREARTERVRYGSLGYMAPERLLGEPEVPAGDVYALGVVLYELVTLDTFGRAELAADRQAEQVARICTQLEGVLGEGGAAFVDLVRRCLAYRVEDRPTPVEAEHALRICARDLPGDDLQTFARDTLPALGITTTGGHDPVAGRVMEEVTGIVDTGAPRPFTTGPHTAAPANGTLVLPQDAVEAIEAPPRRRGPVVVGIGIALVLGRTPEQPAPVPAEPVAAVPPVVDESNEPPPASPPAVAALPAVPTPAAPAPTPVASARSTPRSVATPVPPAPAAAPPEAAAPTGPRLRAAKFTVTGADTISVTCGDVTGSGSTSALLRDFPAGPCSVVAGNGLRTSLTVDSSRGVACTVEGDVLTCR